MTDFEGFCSSCESHPPTAFVVLGSGLGSGVAGLRVRDTCPFAAVPGLPATTATGHRGELLLVEWVGQDVIVSVGRLHFYEGHPWETVVRPIQLAASLGAKVALLTNAAGGIRDDLVPGTLMPIRDHLEWNRPHPWRHPPRPSPYSRRLVDLMATLADGFAPPGVYAAVTGPSYETPAEIRALRSQGADAVGMSTTREAIAGVETGMEVVAISLVTNRAAGLSPAPLDHEEVLAVGRQAAERMGRLLGSLLALL